VKRRFWWCLLASSTFVLALLPLEFLYTPDDAPRKLEETLTALGVSAAWALTGFSFKQWAMTPVFIMGTLFNILLYAGVFYGFSAAATKIKQLGR